MNFHLCAVLISSIVLLVSCDESDFSKSNHQLPIIEITASDVDLWDDSLGIYVDGIGVGENWQGLKANYFSGKKIEIQIRYFVEDSLVLNQTALMNVSGGGSRKQAQKSFNISSKEHFKYPLFKSKSIRDFKSLRLRVSGQDWSSTMLRDGLMHTLIENTHIDYQAYQPVVVYLNNNYWGIYNLREKFSKHYLKQNHHELTGKIDLLENNAQVKSGDNKQYTQLIDFIKNNDLQNDSIYMQIQNWIDLPNFIDYYCAQIYFANTDWPGNNVKFWRAKNEPSKWRWFLHDTDLGFALAPIWGHPGGLEHNTIAFALNDGNTVFHNQSWSTLLFRTLLTNSNFKNAFLSSFAGHLNSTFHPNTVVHAIDSLAGAIESEIPRHINKWSVTEDLAIQSIDDWESAILKLKLFGRKRPAIIRRYLMDNFNLSAEDWDLLGQKKESQKGTL